MVDRYFARDYATARQKFLDVCRDRKLEIETHGHPMRGLVGEVLAADVVHFGARDASRVLIISSGVHGLEMLAGGGVQTGLVDGQAFDNLPSDTAVVLIHGINPWGASHYRRNTEDNVDLCRNFIDFTVEVPHNPAYDLLHDALKCPPVAEAREDNAAARIKALQHQHGPRQFMNGLMAGQYLHADGFGFGGYKATWSRDVLLRVMTQYTQAARHIAVVDIHSGLGPWAHGTAVCLHRDDGLKRARDWYGKAIFAPRDLPPESPEGLFDVNGHCSDGFEREFGSDRITSIVLEFGTYPAEQVFPALLRDHWLTSAGAAYDSLRADNRRRMLELHYPDDSQWRHAIWERSSDVIRAALIGLQKG